MSTLKQPKALQELSAKTIVKLIPTYNIKQYLKCQLPQKILEYLQVAWLKKNLLCSKETLELIHEEQLCYKILKRVKYQRINKKPSLRKVEKLQKECYRDIRRLKEAIRSTAGNAREERRLQTIYDHTLRYNATLMKVYNYIFRKIYNL